MNRILGVAGAVLLCCISCCGQTNTCPPPIGDFALPPIRLRADFGLEPQTTEQTNSEHLSLSIPVQKVALENAFGDGDLFSRRIRPGEFYLTRPEPRPDSDVARFLDRIFMPELIPVGRASFSCPFVTMVKRKNPLSLLSGFTTTQALTGDGQINFKLFELSW
jgi:hypothetical protein